MSDLKRCSSCKEMKPRSEYHKLSRAKDGLASQCKTCCAIAVAKSREKYGRKRDKAKAKEAGRRWRENNSEKYREMKALSDKKYRQNHPDVIARIRKRGYEKNREAIRQKARENYDPDKAKEQYQRFKLSPQYKSKAAAKNQRRLARLRDLPNTLSSQQWDDCQVYFGNACAYCGQRKELEMEHFIPLASPHCPGTVVTNIVPSCYQCNRSKQDKKPHKWLIGKFGTAEADIILKRIMDYFATFGESSN